MTVAAAFSATVAVGILCQTTYLPTPQSRVLLEKLLVPQLVTKCLAFYRT
jgi:hypothetical protein